MYGPNGTPMYNTGEPMYDANATNTRPMPPEYDENGGKLQRDRELSLICNDVIYTVSILWCIALMSCLVFCSR